MPTLVVIYFRAQMLEPEEYTREVEKQQGTGVIVTSTSSTGEASAPKSSTSFTAYLKTTWAVIKQHYRTLIGTTMSWFLLDVTFYGTGSFKSIIGA